MSGPVYEDPELLINWATDKIETGMNFRPDAKAVGWQIGGELVAVVVYDCFSEVDCNMHIASNGGGKWLTRGFLKIAFAHPFIQWRLNRVTGLVPESNKKALRFDSHLGFVFEGVCRKATKNGDNVVILGMLKDECRYLPNSPGVRS